MEANKFLIFTKEVRQLLKIKLQPYVREHKKIGRNDLCHCGSGLKYKKCHLELDNMQIYD